MVIAHKRSLRPGRETTSVSWGQFMEAVRQVVGARCPKDCLAAN